MKTILNKIFFHDETNFHFGSHVNNLSVRAFTMICKILGLHFFCKQLGSDLSLQSFFYFQDFQDSKLLKGCLVVRPNKQALSAFSDF